MIKNTSRIRNIILSLLFTFTILSASALAYDTVTYSFNVDNVNVLAYDCLDESCTAYKAFSGVLPSSSTTDGQLIVKYPAELATPYGYALFFTSPGYLPKEGKSDRHCPEGVPECVNSSSITLNKKAECSSTIEHVTDTINASSKVIINTTIQSAFRDTNTSVGFTPDSLKDDYYSVDTRVILKIFKGTTPVENSPWTKDYTKDSGDAGPPLYMDTVQDVEFTWTPTTYGTYTATVTTQVIDNQCSSSIDTDSPPIIINCINKKPVAEDVTTATDEDTQKQITLIATDTDGDSLEYEIMSGPNEGTATVSGDTATYTPNLNYNGPDSFTYRAYDEQEYSNIATVSITVNPVNDAPVANANGPYSRYINENVQFLGTATDIDGTIESYTWDFDNDGIIDSIEQNPTHAYTQTGTYTVIFSAADNQGATSYDTTTATISINPNPILSIEVTPSIEVDQGNNFIV
ncbi:MAG: cadherin-like domain-containing protein, partial [Candidatus Aenigmarchaeota archaeon]|nr:cadherin-like domain-containing protein [Candidatus Aenigmarchaeota archaeon]